MIAGKSKYYTYAISSATFAPSLGAVRTVEGALGDRLPVRLRTTIDIAVGPLVALSLFSALVLLFADALVTRNIGRMILFGLLVVCSLGVVIWMGTVLITRLH